MLNMHQTNRSTLKQLLFVAHNESSSRGFQEALASYRLHWGVRWADPEQAAGRLRSGRDFDAVVLDRENLGQDLAGTWEQINEANPDLTRFLWCASEGSNDLTPFLGPHSFLVMKDWSASMLNDTLRRGLLVAAWLSRDSLRRVLVHLKILPVLPAIYRQVVAALDDPEGDLEVVGRLIAQDPLMTAKLLHLANSAYFRRSQAVEHPLEAVMILGAQRLRALVLATQVFMMTQGAARSGISLETEWKHCLEVADFASLIARSEGFTAHEAETAFTAGLLHDIGRLLIAANLPEAYRGMLEEIQAAPHDLAQAEERTLGATHADIGALQLAVWGLPLGVVEAAAWHHNPRGVDYNKFSVLTAVYIANILVHQRSARDPGAPSIELDPDYLESMGLLDRRNRWREACHLAIRPEEEPKAVRQEARLVARLR